jgi:hypothetical protein
MRALLDSFQPLRPAHGLDWSLGVAVLAIVCSIAVLLN